MVRRLPFAVGAVAVVAAALFLFTRPAEVEANQFNPAADALRRELAETKQQLAAAQQVVAEQNDQLRAARRRVAFLADELKMEQQDERPDREKPEREGGTVRRLRQQLLAIQGTKYVHFSVWKRKPFVPAAAAAQFMDDAFALLAPQTAPRGMWVGSTSVPQDAGGEMTLLLIFDDRDAHKKYTDDRATKQFYDKQGRRWDNVKALDVVAK